MCEMYIDWLLLHCPQLGTWPATQACALTGNRTGNSLVRRSMLTPLSYTSQGCIYIYKKYWSFLVVSLHSFDIRVILAL